MMSDSALYPRRDVARPAEPAPGSADKSDRRAIIWLAAALVPMIVIGHLPALYHRSASFALACDYGWRLAALAVIAITPLRAVAYRRERSVIPWWEALAWVATILFIEYSLDASVRRAIGAALPPGPWRDGVASMYPPFQIIPPGTGWLLRAIDLTFGISLVAVSEEIIFRRCVRFALRAYVGDGFVMVLLSALLFGAIHWSTGLPNTVTAAIAGGLAMTCYKQSGALWPLILWHFLYDAMAAA